RPGRHPDPAPLALRGLRAFPDLRADLDLAHRVLRLPAGPVRGPAWLRHQPADPSCTERADRAGARAGRQSSGSRGCSPKREVAARVGAAPETVRRWLRTGRLRGVQPGGTRLGYRIAESELARFLGIRENDLSASLQSTSAPPALGRHPADYEEARAYFRRHF